VSSHPSEPPRSNVELKTRVEGLGSFVELEAVASAASDLSGEHDLVRRLRADLKLADAELIAVGYAELLFGAGTPR
jgi:adenylate cyclase class IV